MGPPLPTCQDTSREGRGLQLGTQDAKTMSGVLSEVRGRKEEEDDEES